MGCSLSGLSALYDAVYGGGDAWINQNRFRIVKQLKDGGFAFVYLVKEVVQDGSPSDGRICGKKLKNPNHVSGLEFVGFRSGSDAATAECRDQRVSPTSIPVNGAELNLFGRNRGKGLANGSGEVRTSSMEDMPSVSTRGAGPNGRRIEGFLYRYGRGEDVSIVCVCHGSFLTPAEFVKHAGGGDVAHPLRHIVVNPSPDVFS